MKYLAEMTYAEVQEAAGGAVAILPVGAIEAHGPHLPLLTDVIISRAMAAAGAVELEARGVALGVVTPPVQLTCAAFAAGFAGTLSLDPQTVTAVTADVIRSLHQAGFSKIAIANAHLDPGHLASIHEAVALAKSRDGIEVVFPDVTRKPWALRLTDEFKSGACHAGRYETSIVMAERPDLVRDQVRAALPPNPTSLSTAIREGRKTFEEAGGPEAYFGFPAEATAEEGRATLKTLGAILADAVLGEGASGKV